MRPYLKKRHHKPSTAKKERKRERKERKKERKGRKAFEF
jgi:hypothetical protein